MTAQLMVLELTAPPGRRPYPPERLADVLGKQITVDVTVGGRPFRTPGTVQAAELLDSGNLQLTIRLDGADPRRSMPAADLARCVHGRYRIDPCIGCDRRYEGGELVGRFERAADCCPNCGAFAGDEHRHDCAHDDAQGDEAP